MSIFCKSTLLGIALLLVSCGQAPAPAPEIPATPTVAPPALLPFPQRSVEGLAGFSTARVILRNSQRDALNAEWLKCFPDPHDRPARHTMVADLPGGMLVQIEIVAVVKD